MVSRHRHSGASSTPAASRAGSSATSGEVLTLSSRDVMAGRDEIRIDHHGEIYRLRITNSGKLILTK